MKKLFSAIVLGASVVGGGASAATVDWSATAGSTAWATGSNWGGTAPVDDLTTDIARFNQTSYSNQPNAGTVSINGIQIGDGVTAAAALTLSGTSLSIGSGGITKFAASAAATISSPVKLGASQSWDNNSSTALTVNGAITNIGNAAPFTLSLNGSGTGGTSLGGNISDGGATGTTALTINTTGGSTALGGSNTFTGGVTLNNGSLILNSVNAAGAGTITINGGTLSGQSSGAGLGSYTNAMVWNNDFTLSTPSKSNTWSGNITLAAPITLTVSNNGSNISTIAGTISSTNGIFDVTKAGTGTMVYSPAIALASNQTAKVNAGILRLSGVISGTGVGLTSTGAGTLQLNSANTYTGATTVAVGSTLDLNGATAGVGSSAVTVNGTLTLNGGAAGGTVRAASVTLQGGTLTATGVAANNSLDTVTGALTITGAGGYNIVTVTPNAAKNELLSVGSLVRSNQGIVLFRGTNLGANSIASATANNSNVQIGGTAPALVGGGGAAGSTNISILPYAVGGTTATDAGSTFVTYDAVNGIRTLNTVTEFAGTIAAAGTTDNVRITASSALASNQTINSLILAGGGLTVSGANTLTVTSGAVQLNLGNVAGASTISSGLNFGTAQGVVGYSSNRGATLSGKISGSGGLLVYTNNTTGTTSSAINLTSTTNDYTGDTYLFASATTYSTGGNFFANGSRTGDLYLYSNLGIAQTQNINGLNGSGSITFGHSDNSSTAVFTFGDNNANGSFSGSFNDATRRINKIKIGTGTQVFSGTASNDLGSTAIQNGTLSVVTLNSVVGGTATSSLGAPVTVANGTIALGSTTTTGQLTVVGTGETTDRVINLAGTTGGGTLDQSGTGLLKFTSNFTATGAGSKVLTLQGSTAGRGEIAGAIVDNSGTNKTSLVKSGSGTWVLSGTNTYTGTTTVSTGTLLVNGSLASGSAVSVAAGATLGGSGTINGATTITDGTLSPGNSPGLMNFGGSLTLSGNSTNSLFELATGVRGTDFDGVNVGGTLTYDGTLTLSIASTLANASYNLFDFVADAGDFDSVLLNSGVYSGSFANVSGVWTALAGGQQFVFNESTGDLAVTAVPEPSTYVLFGFGLGALYFLRRNSKKRA